ncbi:tudor domain-containing protein 5 isoform X1 [Nothobranchius furzeri]|uniref:Tudor domain-containing protein 5 n=1 Tax=Nothobranchius furzeri TaxID=105023 RepID=A0A9D2XIM3_NOTFU|nr:transcript variant X1 [Nothobranchius furzeri]
MSQEDVFAKLKKDVRSLLMSSKMGLAPEQLRKDYVNMLGHPMPLKLLGFRNILEAVQEMPDVVSVNYRADGSLFLKAMSNEDTQNIATLVAEQRTSKADAKIKRGFYTAGPRYHHRSISVGLPRRGCAPPPLPAHLRMQLRFLLSQGPIKLSDLEMYYFRCFGNPLRVSNYGFYSIGEMLDAAKDMIVLQQGRQGTVLILREKLLPRPLMVPWASSRNTEPPKPAQLYPHRGPYIKTPETRKPSAGLPVKSPLTQSSESPSDPSRNEPTVSSRLERPEMSHPPKSVPCQDAADLFQDHVLKLEEELHRQILENGIAGSVSQELKDKLRKVVGQRSGGLSIHELPAEYKKLYAEDLPFLKCGFVSVTELIGALSDTFHLKPAEGDNGHHWIVVDLKDCEDRHIDSKTKGRGDLLRMPVKSSYFSFKTSPWEGKQEDGAHDHEEDCTADNDTEEFGPTPTSKTEKKVYPDIEVRLRSTVPLDAVQGQRLKPPTRHKARQLIEVMVEHVESPGDFYISFSDSSESRALEDLMFQMRMCYVCPLVSAQYRLSAPFIRKGQVCCVSPKGLWFYRVVIHRVLNASEVEVYFVDYGDILVVQSDSLKFLKSTYSVLPAQAVPSSLAGIKPTSVNWTPEATASFLELCSNHALVGALDHYEGDILQLYLCDTHTDSDVYVHSVLINQGHGLACSAAASAALCIQVSPVSLYLKDGLVDLPEVDEELISSLRSDVDQSLEASQTEEDAMPDLEPIEEIVGAHIQVMGPSSFNDLLENQTLSCDQQKHTTPEETPPTSPSCLISAAPAVPDLIQTGKSPVNCENEPQTEIPTPPLTPCTPDTSSCPQVEVKTEDSTHSIFTSPVITNVMRQMQDQSPGAAMSPFHLRYPGHLFPLFGTRFSPTLKTFENK